MANIRLTRLSLIDNFPGTPTMNLGIPDNGWDNTKDNFITTSADGTNAYTKGRYPMGTKIAAYSDGTAAPGWYTMMYGAFHCYTNSTTYFSVCSDISEGAFLCSHVGQACGSHTMFDTSAAPWYVLGNCFSAGASEISEGGPLAVPCWSVSGDGSLAALQGYGDAFGWFWVGGVCPVQDVSFLRGLGDSKLGADITSSCDRGQNACATTTGGIPLMLHDATTGAQVWASACAV